jgi:hypothetical protein
MRSMPPAYAKPASDGRRTTWPTQKRFARRSPEPICGSYRPDA